jgi:hypothetical protein
VKPNVEHGGKTLWELEQVSHSFTGSDTNMFWRGLMRDVIFTKTVTDAHWQALEEAGRTDSTLRD